MMATTIRAAEAVRIVQAMHVSLISATMAE